jgi:hypothetical protein
MSDLQQIAEQIQRTLPHLKSGTLQFWGYCFGRPDDNVHRLVRCDADEGYLRLQFNDDEVLSAWLPTEIKATESVFQIVDAARVRWEWFYYGRAKRPDNLYFMDFLKSADAINVTTNVDFLTPHFECTLDKPSVEIL